MLPVQLLAYLLGFLIVNVLHCMKVHPSARQVRYIKLKKKDAQKTHLVNVCESVFLQQKQKRICCWYASEICFYCSLFSSQQLHFKHDTLSGFLVISDTMSGFTWFEIDESLLKEWLSEAVCVFSVPAT